MSTSSDNIRRMAAGEPIARIGAIWYGDVSGTTIPNIYYFGNKNMQSVMPLRAESAISFSTSSPPVDMLQMEIVINYSKFVTHLQRLMAQIQISPVLPVQNPVVAAMTQPVQTNKEVYVAYGFMNVNDKDIKDSSNRRALMNMYATVPVNMKIDNAVIETIPGNPRDVRVILRLTRTLTATVYGDKTQYIRTMEGAVNQNKYIEKLLSESGDNEQIAAMATMMGVNTPAIQDAIDAMSTPISLGEDIGITIGAEVNEVLAPDLYRVTTDDGNSALIMPYGIECFNSREKIRLFMDVSHYDDYPVKGAEKNSVEALGYFIGSMFGLTIPNERLRITGPDFSGANNRITMHTIQKGPIGLLDNPNASNEDVSIHYCIITHDQMGDIGNTLLSLGEAFDSPLYDSEIVPEGYTTARIAAIKAGEETVSKQEAGDTYSTYSCAKVLTRNAKAEIPWTQRRNMRNKISTGVDPSVGFISSPYTATVESITNGDTIVVKKSDNSSVTLGLFGIDAPETGQPGGNEATACLSSLLPIGKTVTIQHVPSGPAGGEVDIFSRYSSIVKSGRLNINTEMLKRGMAWAYPNKRFDVLNEEYENLMVAARDRKIGIWALTEKKAKWTPAEYRRYMQSKGRI